MALSKEDLEQIQKDLIAPLTDQLTTAVQDVLDKRFQPYEDRLLELETKPEPNKTQETKTETEADDPVQKRLNELEKQVEEAKKKEAEADFGNALGGIVDGFKPKYRSEVISHLKGLQDGAKKQPDGSYVTKDGKKLSEAVSEFFSSDYGKHHLAPTHTDGADTPPVKKTSETAKGLTVADFQAML